MENKNIDDTKLFEDIYCETLLKNPQFINLDEMSYFVSSRAKNILKSIPKVTKKEFYSRIEKGDIILAFSPKKIMKKYFTAIVFAKLMATIQSSPYTTSKFIYDKDNAIGYGITAEGDAATEPNQVRIYPNKNILKERQELSLIRVNATKQQKHKAAVYIKNKVGLGYNNSDLYKSIWNRFFDRKLLPFFKDEPLNPKAIIELQNKGLCISIIALAYTVGGYKHNFNNKHPYDVWPKDFLVDENTEKICRVEYGY